MENQITRLCHRVQNPSIHITPTAFFAMAVLIDGFGGYLLPVNSNTVLLQISW
jgi:hypothetical protein